MPGYKKSACPKAQSDSNKEVSTFSKAAQEFPLKWKFLGCLFSYPAIDGGWFDTSTMQSHLHCIGEKGTAKR